MYSIEEERAYQINYLVSGQRRRVNKSLAPMGIKPIGCMNRRENLLVDIETETTPAIETSIDNQHIHGRQGVNAVLYACYSMKEII